MSAAMNAASAQKKEAAAKIRDWLNGVLAHTGMSPAAWAKKADLAPSTIQRAIKPTYEFVTSSTTLSKLAAVAGVDAPDINPTREKQIVPFTLPVRYRVRAGYWAEMDDYGEPVDRPQPVTPDPRYAEWPQWMELVEGDSANLRFPDGCYAHVVDAIEMGYAARQDDWVICERRRGGNGNMWQVRERTIKQVEKRGNEVLLWPRSTNPKWADAVSYLNGAAEGEDVEVEIVGLVIGSYNPV